jgi:hypothetical protein
MAFAAQIQKAGNEPRLYYLATIQFDPAIIFDSRLCVRNFFHAEETI